MRPLVRLSSRRAYGYNEITPGMTCDKRKGLSPLKRQPAQTRSATGLCDAAPAHRQLPDQPEIQVTRGERDGFGINAAAWTNRGRLRAHVGPTARIQRCSGLQRE